MILIMPVTEIIQTVTNYSLYMYLLVPSKSGSHLLRVLERKIGIFLIYQCFLTEASLIHPTENQKVTLIFFLVYQFIQD